MLKIKYLLLIVILFISGCNNDLYEQPGCYKKDIGCKDGYICNTMGFNDVCIKDKGNTFYLIKNKTADIKDGLINFASNRTYINFTDIPLNSTYCINEYNYTLECKWFKGLDSNYHKFCYTFPVNKEICKIKEG